MSKTAIMTLESVSKYYGLNGSVVKALKKVNFELKD